MNVGCVPFAEPVAPGAGVSVTHFHCKAAAARCRLVQASNFEKQSNQEVKENNEFVNVRVHVGSVRWSGHSVKSKCSWAGAAVVGAAELGRSCATGQLLPAPARSAPNMPTGSASCLCP